MAKKEDTFLLVSLDEEKAKKLASVIGSEVCRKILDYLAKKESSESELSSQLDVPISTVHYNIRQLVQIGLVKSDEFHYSEKGKEVSHYALSNKYIIIAPKNSEGLLAKIKKILPALGLAGGTGLAIHLLNGLNKAASNSGEMAMDSYTAGISSTAQKATMSAPMAAEQAISNAAGQGHGLSASLMHNIGVWFVIGAIFSLGAFILIEKIKERFK